MARTGLFSRKQSGGMFAIEDNSFMTGERFFVDSVTGADTVGSGKNPDAPFKTIDYAIGQTTADKGDVIYVMPLHVETITAAAGVALDVAGVTIRGLGKGRQRGKVNYTTAIGASFDISAARCVVQNLVFTPIGFDAITAAVNVTAADCSILDCEFELADATNQAVLGVLTNASASRLRIENCHFHGSTDAGTSAAIRIVGGDALTVKDNVIEGAFATTGNIENITTLSSMLTITGNSLLNRTADGNNKVINVISTTTGLITNNRGGIIDSTAPAPVTAAGMHVGGNWWSSAADVTASVLM